jgi:Mor family transcriptional regulator
MTDDLASTTRDPRGRRFKLPEETRAEIRKEWAERVTQKSLAAKHNCSIHLICEIVTRRNERRRKQKAKRSAA